MCDCEDIFAAKRRGKGWENAKQFTLKIVQSEIRCKRTSLFQQTRDDTIRCFRNVCKLLVEIVELKFRQSLRGARVVWVRLGWKVQVGVSPQEVKDFGAEIFSRARVRKSWRICNRSG